MRDPFSEGKVKKGGVNSKPTGPRPPDPKGQGDGTRLPPVTINSEKDVTDQEALALVLYMLFGPNATLELDEGGYMRWEEGRMTAGILEQIDKRLVRLEELHDLEPMKFVVNDEEDE